MAIGTDGSIYYLADGGMATWEATRVYAINKDDGSLKWKTDALEIWHPNSNIIVADDVEVLRFPDAFFLVIKTASTYNLSFFPL